MFKNRDNIGWLVFLGMAFLLLEILFFNRGLIFSLFIAGVMIYLARKYSGKKRGRILFISGILFLVISLLNMITFKFILFVILLHFFYQYISSKKHPKTISPHLTEPEEYNQEEILIRTKPLFENIFLGQQKTPIHVYEWNDINIQAGIGDTVIDLSLTMLPKGETVIFIRNLIGNIQILVPYETEVSVDHSSIVGSASVFGVREPRFFNHVFQMKPPGYNLAEQKVKILTSLIVGHLEVNRT